MKRQLHSFVACAALFASSVSVAMDTNKIKIATFNVSMEALNYIEKGTAPTGDELNSALASQHQQIKNIAEIIQRVNPDIILLNEFDRTDDNSVALTKFIKEYLNQSQQQQAPVNYPYTYQGPVNTGVKMSVDVNGDKAITQPQDTYGFGYFPGHFGMALLSKHPIVTNEIRTFQQFKWQDMPGALKPMLDGNSFYSEEVWQQFRLSSKSHWDIPVKVANKTVHVLASHPTPPVFDGPEDRNGKRNHDEIRFWHDYITPAQNGYIYDDKGSKGGLNTNTPFVILGDLNASDVDGDAIKAGIAGLKNHPFVQDPKPASIGGAQHKPDNDNSKYHTAYWGMRADYVLPSTYGWQVTDSGVFWPSKNDGLYRLIDSRSASSDHRLVWVELTFK